jgi:tetratricopeptide (TPR) repeat protein
MFADQLEDHLGELAYHYSCSDNRQKAIEYLRRAGDNARLNSAYSRASDYLFAALKIVQSLPAESRSGRDELLIESSLGISIVHLKGPASSEVEEHLGRAKQLCAQLHDDAEIFPVLSGLVTFYNFRGDLQRSRELVAQLIPLADTRVSPSNRVGAQIVAANTRFVAGEFLDARSHWQVAASVYDQALAGEVAGVDNPRVAWPFIGWVLWFLGFPEQALARVKETVAVAQKLGDAYSSAFSLFAASQLYRDVGDQVAAREHVKAAVSAASRYGSSYQLARAAFVKGATEARFGDVSRGLEEMRAAAKQIKATGASVRTYQYALLAKACGDAGQIDNGLEFVVRGLELQNDTGERLGYPELFRVRGELLSRGGEQSDAEAALRAAVEAAAAQQARSYELRATTSLARLLRDINRGDEAQAMLAEIYNWFTEGFDTADLKDAKALLDELSI